MTAALVRYVCPSLTEVEVERLVAKRGGGGCEGGGGGLVQSLWCEGGGGLWSCFDRPSTRTASAS